MQIEDEALNDIHLSVPQWLVPLILLLKTAPVLPYLAFLMRLEGISGAIYIFIICVKPSIFCHI
jgi:hypothetical protein